MAESGSYEELWLSGLRIKTIIPQAADIGSYTTVAGLYVILISNHTGFLSF